MALILEALVDYFPHEEIDDFLNCLKEITKYFKAFYVYKWGDYISYIPDKRTTYHFRNPL